jgi:hypothetical protein
MEQREQSQAWLELCRVATEEDESQRKEIKEILQPQIYLRLRISRARLCRLLPKGRKNYTNYSKAKIYLSELNELLSLCSNGTVVHRSEATNFFYFLHFLRPFGSKRQSRALRDNNRGILDTKGL